MYMAITTKFHGPTNSRGQRVKATSEAGTLTIHWDDNLNSDKNHIAAARALAVKWGWDGRWYGGGTADGCVFVRVIASNEQPAFHILGV